MRPDQFKKRHRTPLANDRLRRQIAVEAARRMLRSAAEVDESIGTPASLDWLAEAPESAFYAAKRKAAAVLGHSVRPGDLPADSEVREQVIILARAGGGPGDEAPEPGTEGGPARLADLLDRFAVYRLRLAPLEAVKQDPRTHPEGDALFHSLQVFERARDAHPYDEEFLLAALLHDVGKAIDPREPGPAGVEALRGSIPERTLALIAGFHDVRTGSTPDDADFRDDLAALREIDAAGRVPGVPVGTIEEALDYLAGLEREAYLE
ncbi:HD domain-containing protein [Tundrisphaera sp. TA3]|uniref:HD domain-containing protein n=1 Tax=Tundrisphaera sp. TA3 TaxID=3435775 RepID=UPI003EBA4C8C